LRVHFHLNAIFAQEIYQPVGNRIDKIIREYLI